MSLDPGAGVGNQMCIRSGTRVAVFTNSNIGRKETSKLR